MFIIYKFCKPILITLALFAFSGYAQISLPPAEEVRVIVDNQEAFKSKVDLIGKAQKSINMIYYIYSDDETSAYLTQMLIQKAQQGVQVRILLDLHNNYNRLDLFRMMEDKGKGNLKVRFFNGINPQLLKNIVFMTADCTKEAKNNKEKCKNERLENANRISNRYADNHEKGLNTELPFTTSVFLAGMYGKNIAALRMGIMLGIGKSLVQLKPLVNGLKNNNPTVQEELVQWLKPLEINKNAPLTGSEALKLQLGLISQAHGGALDDTVQMLDSAMPDSLQSSEEGAVTWLHFTDFVHHKLLLIDGKYVQLGGRNIENSYHMNEKISPGDKYLFRDTDVVITFENPAESLTQSFERLYGFRTMVMTLDEVLHYFDNSILMKLPEIVEGYVQCQKSGAVDLDNCIQGFYSEVNIKLSERMATTYKQMVERAHNPIVIEALHSPGEFYWGGQSNDSLSAQDLSKLNISYLENLPYDTSSYKPYGQRLMFQKKRTVQSENAKHIHQTVIEGIEKICGQATEAFSKIPAAMRQDYLENADNRRRIILYQGYIFLPGVLMVPLGKTVNQDVVEDNADNFHCPGVDIDIITNSSVTTDLNIINILSKPQMALLIAEQARSNAYYQERIQNAPYETNLYPPARIRYYTMQPPMDGQNINYSKLMSLHSKVFLLDNYGVLIGSANGDLRSYFMDTNNGVLIHGADEFTHNFIKWLDSLKAEEAANNSVFVDETMTLLNFGQRIHAQKEGDVRGLFKTLYEGELKRLVNERIHQWRQKSIEDSEADPHATEKKAEKLLYFFPSLLNSVAFLASEVYTMSDKLVSGKLSEGEKKYLMERLRTIFGVL